MDVSFVLVLENELTIVDPIRNGFRLIVPELDCRTESDHLFDLQLVEELWLQSDITAGKIEAVQDNFADQIQN